MSRLQNGISQTQKWRASRLKVIKDGDVDATDMCVIGYDEFGLPLFQPMIEFYVDQLMKQPVGTISKKQEEIIDIWIETRRAKIRNAYKVFADLAEENNKLRRHFSLGWGAK